MLSIAVLAAVYFLSAKLGLKLALVNPYATAVWPPTGIALAALLLYGRRLWPGILIGAFVANVTAGSNITPVSALASLGIAAGNTLEALIGAWLVNRFAGGLRAFDRARNVFRFAGLAGLASPAVSATIGVSIVLLAGFAKSVDASAIWLTWWIGDAVGDLVLAPALLLWAIDWRLRWNRARAFEAALVLLFLVSSAGFAFTSLLGTGDLAHMGLAFLAGPALLWSAFRFGQRESSTALVLTSAIAIWGWSHGLTAGNLSADYVLLELQVYLGVTSVMILAVAAEVSERR